MRLDEIVPDDADYIWIDSGAVGDWVEILLSDLIGDPSSQNPIIRWRTKRIAGTSILGVTCELRQGTMIKKFHTVAIETDDWLTNSFEHTLGGITDWSDLRLRFAISYIMGGGENSLAISWAELELLDDVEAFGPSITMIS